MKIAERFTGYKLSTLPLYNIKKRISTEKKLHDRFKHSLWHILLHPYFLQKLILNSTFHSRPRIKNLRLLKIFFFKDWTLSTDIDRNRCRSLPKCSLDFSGKVPGPNKAFRLHTSDNHFKLWSVWKSYQKKRRRRREAREVKKT